MSTPRLQLFGRWRRTGGALALVLFAAPFLYVLIPEIAANLAAAGWTSTSCTIVSSRVDRQRMRDGDDVFPLYRFDVRYAYGAGGTRYESTRYRFVDPFTENSAAAEGAAARYPAGAVVACYVDPTDATQAVLERELSPFMLIVLLPAAIAGLGLWDLGGIGVEIVRELF